MDKKTFIDKIKTMFSDMENNVEEEVVMEQETTQENVEEEEVAMEQEVIEEQVVEENVEEVAMEEEAVIDIIKEDKDCECKGEEECECDKEEEEEKDVDIEEEKDVDIEAGGKDKKKDKEYNEESSDPLESRIKALEIAISNLSETLSSVELLSQKVEKLSALPADEEIKLSKLDNFKNNKISDKERRLNIFSKK